MRTNDLIARSIAIITAYYENDLGPFFESIGDDVLWIGPSERQYIRGKANLIETFGRESHALTFTMGDIRAMCLTPHSRVREIILHYDVYTHYPTGNIDRHDQRLHFTWRERRAREGEGEGWVSELVLVHISNAWHLTSLSTESAELDDGSLVTVSARRFDQIRAQLREVRRPSSLPEREISHLMGDAMGWAEDRAARPSPARRSQHHPRRG